MCASSLQSQHPCYIAVMSRDVIQTQATRAWVVVQFERGFRRSPVLPALARCQLPQSCPNCGTELLPKTRETARVITVRMPKSLHDQLKVEAQTAGVSMNTVCVRKLYTPLRDVPVELAPTG